MYTEETGAYHLNNHPVARSVHPPFRVRGNSSLINDESLVIVRVEFKHFAAVSHSRVKIT